ncbi:MAG: hypothetical protein WBU92_04505 [Candidatus Dormiibacterota bacterium]
MSAVVVLFALAVLVAIWEGAIWPLRALLLLLSVAVLVGAGIYQQRRGKA